MDKEEGASPKTVKPIETGWQSGNLANLANSASRKDAGKMGKWENESSTRRVKPHPKCLSLLANHRHF